MIQVRRYIGLAVIGVFVLGIGWFIYIWADWSLNKDSYAQDLKILNLQVMGRETEASVLVLPTRIYDQTGETKIGQFYRENRRILSFKKIAKLNRVKRALILSEDRDFYEHEGYSLLKMGKAMARSIYYGTLSGGSTITQQLAKLLFTDASRTIARKVREVFCAALIEESYDKETILAMYLNKIYFGHKRYGVAEAAEFYFNKKAKGLTYAEISMLIGIIPNPTAFSPVNKLQNALYKQRLVLRNLVEQKLIGPKQAQQELAIFFKNYKIPQLLQKRFVHLLDELPERLEAPKGGWKSLLGRHIRKQKILESKQSAFFNEYVRRFIVERFGEEKLRAGLTVFTTIHAHKQTQAYRAVREQLEKHRSPLLAAYEQAEKQGNETAAMALKEELNGLNAALVSIRPDNGYVEALVGGYEFSSANQLNRAISTKRQPGSTFKPFVYYAAYSQKQLTPYDCIIDEQINFNGYAPRNYYGSFKGDMTVLTALAKSVNTAAVKTLHKTGVETVRDSVAALLQMSSGKGADRFGNDLSMGLGSKELSVMELAKMYAGLLNSGRAVEPVLILKIFDKDKNLIYAKDPSEGEQVLDPLAAYMTIQTMTAVTQKYKLPFPSAGKTGSTQLAPKWKKKFKKTHPGRNTRDAWFAGLTSNLATVVWVGNDKGYPIKGGGASTAAPIWVSYVRQVYSKSRFSKEEIKQAADILATEQPWLAGPASSANQEKNNISEAGPTGTGPSDGGANQPNGSGIDGSGVEGSEPGIIDDEDMAPVIPERPQTAPNRPRYTVYPTNFYLPPGVEFVSQAACPIIQADGESNECELIPGQLFFPDRPANLECW